jgi:hypothetical protein
MLSRIDLRSPNIASERERKLQLTTNFFTPLGPKPPPPETPPDPKASPPPPPKPRPSVFLWLTGTLRLGDVVMLQPGAAPLNLLDGATLTGSGGQPRWHVEGNIGGSIGPVQLGTHSRLDGPTRIRSALAAADLSFSGRTWVVAYANFDAENMVTRPCARKLQLQFTIENLLNDCVNVTDRNGTTPNRYQPGYLDAVGRSMRVGVRKLL